MIAGGSELSDSSSEKGLYLDELELGWSRASSLLSKRAERWGGGGGGGRRSVIGGLGARMFGSEWDVRWSLRGRGLGVDWGVGRINVLEWY
jgi:hypothetical protein